MELMNSYENRYGEYLKCVIASRVARDGLNFRNIQSIHLVEPDRNPSTMYQAISRGIRSGSHDDLLNEGKKVIIKVYKHAAIPDKKYFTNTEWIIDLRNYKAAEEKNVKISEMLDKLKSCAVGCQINTLRNQFINCIDPPYKTIDTSTYNAYYIEENAKQLIPTLIPLLSNFNYFTINDLPKFDKDLLMVALNLIMVSKTPITNKFGFYNYLYEKDGVYFLSRNYINGQLNEVLYSHQIIVSNDNSENFIKNLDEQHYINFLELINENDIIREFKLLSIDNKIKILEEQFINKDIKYNKLIHPYLNFFYKIDEYKRSNITMVSKKSGTCADNKIKTGNKIIVNLLNLLKTANKHTLVQDYLKAKATLRLYYNNKWQESNECEEDLYHDIIGQINVNVFTSMQNKFNYLFGIQLGEDILIVYDKDGGDKQEGKVGKEQGRGKQCGSFQKEEVIEIAKKLKISENKIKEHNKISELCELIKNQLVTEERLFTIKNDF